MLNKSEIIAKVNPSWPKDLIIRYLYISLAPTFERDLNFFQATPDEQYEMYLNHYPNYDDTHVICVTICEYYEKLFKTFGIDCEIIQTNIKKVPHHGLIVHGDTKSYFIDPLKDLGLNQLGCATKFYGIIPLSTTKDNLSEHPYLVTLPPKYLQEMDQYLGLLQCGMYMDDFFLELHNELMTRTNYDDILALINETPLSAGIPPHTNLYSNPKNSINDYYVAARIELMNRYLINLGNIPGIMERHQLYQYIITQIFTKQEKKKLQPYITPAGELTLLKRTNNQLEIYKESNDNGIFKLSRQK